MNRFATVICALCMVVLTGCSGIIQGESEPKMNSNDRAIQYMEEKYGESFTYASPWGNSLSGTHELLVNCDSLSDLVLVEMENYRSDNPIFRDNYLAVKYEDETRQFIQDCADTVFGKANVYYKAMRTGLSENLPADASFEEYMADQRVPLNPLIEISTDDFASEEQLWQLLERLNEYGTLYLGLIAVVDNEDFGNATEDELEEQMVLRDIQGFQYRVTENGPSILEFIDDWEYAPLTPPEN